MIRSRLPIVLMLTLVGGAPVRAQDATDFGAVRFATSAGAEAQDHFERGVAALHSFEYEEALDAFKAAQAVEPEFALAYWGEAMTYHQALWHNEDPERARASLARLGPTRESRAARAPTPRERAWLNTAEVLFAAGDRARRRVEYLAAMAHLVHEYPDDLEAQAFHALALLGSMARGVASGPMAGDERHVHGLVGSTEQEQAVEILERVLDRSPDHPGALHYLIHALDDPVNAERALPAARRYARVAPAASHALHMPAHIFLQLGLWDEAAASDEASWAASEAWIDRRGHSIALLDFHSLNWLQYHYLQAGRFREAHERQAPLADAVDLTDQPQLKNILASMRARDVVETERWEAFRGKRDVWNNDELYVVGLSAARLGDLDLAELARQTLEARAAPERAREWRPIFQIMERAVAGLIRHAQGRADEAIRLLREAAEMERSLPPPTGPPIPVKPAPELLGEVLIELGRAADAAEPFEWTLARSANRSASVLGLARVAAATGDRDTAERRYRQLLDNWSKADPGLLAVLEARRYLGGTTAEPDEAGGADGPALWIWLLPAVAIAGGLVWRWRAGGTVRRAAPTAAAEGGTTRAERRRREQARRS